MLATFLSQPVVFSCSWVELTGLAVLAGIAGLYRKVNCHEPWCWRLARHPVAGTPYVTCHKHHPGLVGSKVKPGHIQAAHARATSSLSG